MNHDFRVNTREVIEGLFCMHDLGHYRTNARQVVEGLFSLGDLEHYTGSTEALYRLAALEKILYKHGPGHGLFLSLPFDQLVEHGPGHRMIWKRDNLVAVSQKGTGSADPRTVIDLCNMGDYSAVVLHPGILEKYRIFLDHTPKIYKIDGHMTVPAKPSIPSNIGSVSEARKMGCEAVGCSFYPGAEMTREDMERVSAIVRETHDQGLVSVVWAYARGPGVDDVGADSLYWTSYACVVAESMGADIIKTKFPAPVAEKKRAQYFDYLEKVAKKVPDAKDFIELENRPEAVSEKDFLTYRMKVLREMTPGTVMVVSGGPKTEPKDGENPLEAAKRELAYTTEIVMDAGAEGRIIGRNFWGVPVDEGLGLTEAVKKVMRNEKYYRDSQ